MAAAESHIKHPADPEVPRQLYNDLKEASRSHQILPILPIFGLFLLLAFFLTF